MRLLLSIVACGEPEPDPCEPMCQEAAVLYGGCLADWGLEWSAAGYEDEQHFLLSCATWAWELRELEEAALERGELGRTGSVDAVCVEREELFSDGVCSDYTDIDWSELPWD
jgi:hypothetical protein